VPDLARAKNMPALLVNAWRGNKGAIIKLEHELMRHGLRPWFGVTEQVLELKDAPQDALRLWATFLTRLGESGCDAWTLARTAGHSSITISSRYVHPSEDAVVSATSRLGGHKTGHSVEPEHCETASKVSLSA